MAEAKTTKTAKPVKRPVRPGADKAGKAFDDAIETMSGLLAVSGAPVPELFRTVSETSINQAREAYARLKSVTEEATDVLEETFENTRDGVLQAQHKALDVARDNAEATFDFAKKLLSVSSVADVVQLQAGFMRGRLEAYIDYAKGIEATATKLVEGASEPAKAAVAKSLNKVKAA